MSLLSLGLCVFCGCVVWVHLNVNKYQGTFGVGLILLLSAVLQRNGTLAGGRVPLASVAVVYTPQTNACYFPRWRGLSHTHKDRNNLRRGIVLAVLGLRILASRSQRGICVVIREWTPSLTTMTSQTKHSLSLSLTLTLTLSELTHIRLVWTLEKRQMRI